MSKAVTYCMSRLAGGRLCQAPIALGETYCAACRALLATVPERWHVLAAADRVQLQDKVHSAALNAWLPVTLGDAGLGRLVRDTGALVIRREGQ